MTLNDIKTVTKEIEKLKAKMPRKPTPEDQKSAAFLASLSGPELSRLGTILVRWDNGHEPDQEDLEFMLMLAQRPAPPLQETDPTKPVCALCGLQPAHERNYNYGTLCDSCYDGQGGNVDLSKL
jgi:hypothetical protein